MKDSGVQWIGEIPEHWEVKKLKHLGKFVSGYAFPSNAFISDGTKVMKINNIQTMNLDWSDISYVANDWLERFKQYQLKRGDLVIALTRPIISTGIKAAIVDTDEEILLNQRNAYFRNNKLIPSNWLYYLLLNHSFVEEFESLIDRTGQQPNISTADIENIKIPLPSFEEIQQITDYLKDRSTEIEKIKVNTLIQIEKLKEYRQSLIYEAVTGKIDVREIELD
nr:restriction endonuclease subunit S [Lysinibacillus sphaericus]